MAENLTPKSLRYYRQTIGRFLQTINPDKANPEMIDKYLLQFPNAGGRHAHWRAIKAFFNWREDVFDYANPTKKMKAPKLSKLILPTLNKEQVLLLIEKAETTRDKAIISLLTESGMRLSELANVKVEDINWQEHTIRVIGKGRKERDTPFTEFSGKYLQQVLEERNITSGNIWDIKPWGIVSMLRRLERDTGLPANPHVFRRSFATIMKSMGVDISIIRQLGGWESLQMVERYTRAFSFKDALRHYKSPLSA